MTPRRVAEELRLLGAERGEPREDRLVVGLAAVVAAAAVRREDLPAQLAVGRALQERPDARRLEREHPLPGQAGRGRGRRRRLNLVVGQAGEVGPILDDQLEGVGLLEQVGAELDGQPRQLGVDGAQAVLLRRREVRAAADEAPVRTVEERGLLGIERELRARVVDRLDPREQRLVEEDVVGMPGEHRLDLGLDGLQGVAGLGPGEDAEDVDDAGERLAGVVKRRHRVVEGGRRVARGDRRDLAVVLAHRHGERRQEVLRPDPLERRQAVRRGPLAEQRVRGRSRRGRGGHDRCAQHHEADEGDDRSHAVSLARRRRLAPVVGDSRPPRPVSRRAVRTAGRPRLPHPGGRGFVRRW